MRAQLAGYEREREQMRAEIAMFRSAARIPEPVIEQSTHRGGSWDDYPEYDQDYIDAAVLHGTHSEQARTAMRAARQRIEQRKAASQPGTIGEFDLADKRRDLNAQMDMTGLPIEPGGVMTRDPQTSQVHVQYPVQLSCSAGHPAADGAQFCTTCGSAVSSPAIGQGWPGNDPADLLPSRERELARERRIEEGTI